MLFAGVLLIASQAFAQNRPASTENDPKLIFMQNFEPKDETVTADEAWSVWQATPVDTITSLIYYNKTGNSSTSGADIYSGSADWTTIERTDSVIVLYNGVVTTDDASDIKGGYYNNDQYRVKSDGSSSERAQAFEKYAEDGGDYFFSYVSADATGAGNYSSGVVPNYRRNLFVRGLPIEDNTSYRLTFFVKGRQLAGTTPTLYADVMRGYFHSEKPFSMSSTSGTFEYSKSNFNGQWEKITFMTYYLNDSVANGFVYQNGYWWYNDWTWNANDREYNYIQQPDKFFVRLSFASDSTDFEVDNISLTKSWIGGVEHFGNMIRVDFGYETNLLELAKAAYAETNIAAVELPGQYFSVYGYYAKGANKGWYPIDIASAEYHDDGYMYMWSKDAAKGVPNYFTYYDSILVSFTNPIENDKICLKYNGSTYPCALDEDWVAAGKPVKDFTNEISKLNPNITKDKKGKPVYSMKQLPPVVTSLPFENYSFGLASFNEITVGMSREIMFDNTGEASELAYLRVTKTGFKEIWKVKESTDSTATFERLAADIAAHGDLTGTLQFEFVNLKGEATDYRTPNPTYFYEFGVLDTNPNPNPEAIFKTDWRNQEGMQNEGIPFGMHIWDGNNSFNDPKSTGKGTKEGTKARVYYTNPETSGGLDCGFYISARKSEDGGHLYYGFEDGYNLNLQSGSYSLNFKAANWDGYELPITVYIFAKGLTENPQTSPVDEDKKIEIGKFTPTVKASSTNIQNQSDPFGTWEWQEYSFSFNVPATGDYIIEWYTQCGESGNAKSYGGMLMSNFNITKGLGLSYAYVLAFNKAIADADVMLENTNVKKYQGADREAYSTFVDSYRSWQSTAPSAYDKTTAAIKDATATMQLRVDTVDLYYTTEGKAIDKLAEFDDDTLGYKELAAFVALNDLVDANAEYDPSTKTSSEITADIKAYNDAIDALDARLALITKFDNKLAEVKGIIDAAAHADYDEYAAMVRAYDVAAAYDQIKPSDDEFNAAYNELVAGENGYVFKVDYIIAKTRQIKELFALADTLGYDFGGKKADVKATVDALLDDDAALNNVLREAAILQILKIYASDDAAKKEELNGLDVSALIPNYFLYTEAEVDRDMEKNSSGNWRLKDGQNTTAYPGWTFTRTGGNWIPTTVKVGEGEGYIDWEVDGHVFVAGLRCKSQSRAQFSTVVEGLPHGFYWFGLYGYNQTSGVNITLNETSGKLNDWNNGSKFNYKEVGADSVLVADKLSFAFNQTSQSSSEFDIRYFILRLEGADTATYDYSADVAAQEAKLADAITFVAAPVQEVGEQLFNLGGVRIDAAKPGQIIIRRKALGSGKSAVEKVLVK